MKTRFHYAFQACNGADEERRFVVAARHGALSEIAAFLPGVPGGRTLIDKPGEVEHLGIVASAQPDPAELATAAAVLSSVKIAPRRLSAIHAKRQPAKRQRADPRHSEPGRAGGRRPQRVGDGRGEVTAPRLRL